MLITDKGEFEQEYLLTLDSGKSLILRLLTINKVGIANKACGKSVIAGLWWSVESSRWSVNNLSNLIMSVVCRHCTNSAKHYFVLTKAKTNLKTTILYTM